MKNQTGKTALVPAYIFAAVMSVLVMGSALAATYPPTQGSAFVCDQSNQRLSSVLNGNPMPVVTVLLNNSIDANTVRLRLAGHRKIGVPRDTSIEALNTALRAPTDEGVVREFYFYAENYSFGDTIVVTQPVQLIGTNTNAAGISDASQRTRITGENNPRLFAAIKASADDVHNPNNVIIRYLTIENFGRDPNTAGGLSPRPRDGKWAIDSQDHYGWTITNNHIVGNEVSGLRAGSLATVHDNCFEKNGRYGMSELKAFNQDIKHNEFWNNGSAWSGAERPDRGDHGAMKFFATRTINMQQNWVRDNVGKGIWFDTNNSDVIIDNNTVEGNFGQGIMYETSYKAQIWNNNVINNNKVAREKVPYPGTPTNAGIFISNSGGALLVGGPTKQYVTQDTDTTLVNNDYLSVLGNRLEGNKYGITLFQNPNRFCGSHDESSRQWCTLTGGRREVNREADNDPDRYLVKFRDATQIGAPDLSSPWNNSAYVSCMYLPFGQGTPASPLADDLRKSCFWNTTGVIVLGNKMVVNANVSQQALIYQQAADSCVYSDKHICDFRAQNPDLPNNTNSFKSKPSPFYAPDGSGDTAKNTYFLDLMIESNWIGSNKWIGSKHAPTCPTREDVSNGGQIGEGADRYCTGWY